MLLGSRGGGGRAGGGAGLADSYNRLLELGASLAAFHHGGGQGSLLSTQESMLTGFKREATAAVRPRLMR
jgi:hypothetical protein